MLVPVDDLVVDLCVISADPEASGTFLSTGALTQPTAPAPITVVVFHNQVCVPLR